MLVRLLLISFLLPVYLPAQSLVGHWVGRLSVGDSSMPYELMITGNDERPKGFEQITFSIGGIENVGVKSIRIKRKNKAVTIEDLELVYNNYQVPPKPVKLYAKLVLVSDSSVLQLKGSFYTRTQNIRDPLHVFSEGQVWLTKPMETSYTSRFLEKLSELKLVKDSASLDRTDDLAKGTSQSAAQELGQQAADSALPQGSAVPMPVTIAESQSKPIVSAVSTDDGDKPAGPRKGKEASAGKPPKPGQGAETTSKKKTTLPVLAPIAPPPPPRHTDIIDSVWIDTDSVSITLYDNSEVDGDTVSVLLNDQTIMSRVGLSANPVSFTFSVNIPGVDSMLLILYPNNLGLIAPNTGLLILQSGENRFTIGFSGDLQRNPAILLRRRRP